MVSFTPRLLYPRGKERRIMRIKIPILTSAQQKWSKACPCIPTVELKGLSLQRFEIILNNITN
jgi:hypothetical protein